MPRPRKPARLWQRADGAWIILDGTKQHRTGHSGEGGRRAAEESLRDYLATRAPDRSGPAQPHEITVGEVLALYAREKGPTLASPEALAYAVRALSPFWGSRTCDAVKGSTCRAYLAARAKPRQGRDGRTRTAGTGTVRRELGVLQAAINHAYSEGVLVYAPAVTLSDAGPARDRWLTRSDAARLMWAAAPHLRRFIAIELRAGRRARAVLELRLEPSLDSGWIDAEAGIIHFEGARQRRTKKRKGSIRAPDKLAAHLRRWARLGGTHAIMWKGKPLAEIDTAFAAATRRAGLEDLTVHDLKRTAVTWAFQRGMSLEDAADWFDTSPATLMKHYRAHSPHHQTRARTIMDGR